MPTANKAIHTAQGPWPLQGPCLSRAQRHLPGQKSEPKHQACLTEACRCEAGSAGGPGHPSLVTILTAGVAWNPIHPAAAAPAGVSRAPGAPAGALGDPADLSAADSAPDPVAAVLLLHHDLALWAMHGLTLLQHGSQHLRRLPGSHIVLSSQGQVILILLAVHLLMDGLEQMRRSR